MLPLVVLLNRQVGRTKYHCCAFTVGLAIFHRYEVGNGPQGAGVTRMIDVSGVVYKYIWRGDVDQKQCGLVTPWSPGYCLYLLLVPASNHAGHACC